MLADNILFLKKNYPVLYNALKKSEEDREQEFITLEDTKNNCKTLKLKKAEKSLYLHSKYDPIREAESIIDRLEEREEIDEKTHVVFYGVGLGYHIDAFVRRFPETAFSLYEPSVEVFNCFLSYKKLKDWPTKKIFTIQCEINPQAMDEFFNSVLNNTDKKTITMNLPIYQNAFEERYAQFSNRFMKAIKSKRSLLNTNYSFKRRWIINSVNNFKEVLSTPNILMEDKYVFKDKLAILVSAGPSLDYEIENLRKIKNEGLAFIFSVGSAINTLLHHDIYPDAMCTYDPLEVNQAVFAKANEMGITSIPMIFGSSVGYEVLENYKGPKYHMITSQDTVSDYFLKELEEREIKKVFDAPSIAVVTLELLEKLGFSKVTLVGQNLAYKDDKNYAGGIEYYKDGVSKTNEAKLKVKDVYNNDVITTDGFNSMREQMEYYIKNFNMAVINTTIGGAHIEGTEFIPLGKVTTDTLNTQIVKGNEFDSISKIDLYDDVYLKTQLSKINEEFEQYKLLLSQIKQQLIRLYELVANKNAKQAYNTYDKLNVFLTNLEANDFFKTIALPMNRVEYELLALKIQRIKTEKNSFVMAKKTIKPTEILIDALYCDNEVNENIIKVLNNIIMRHLSSVEEAIVNS